MIKRIEHDQPKKCLKIEGRKEKEHVPIRYIFTRKDKKLRRGAGRGNAFEHGRGRWELNLTMWTLTLDFSMRKRDEEERT